MEIYQKLINARKYIRTLDSKKEGTNTHSRYDYFTPSQISQMVFQACEDQQLFTKFDLMRDELGVVGLLEIVNIPKPEETLRFTMASAIPTITATNAAQQLGGCVTYTERYLLMTAFDIKDNNLDPDTTDNTKKTVAKDETIKPKTLTVPEVEEKWNGKLYKGNIVYIDKVKYSITPEQAEKLKAHPKYVKS